MSKWLLTKEERNEIYDTMPNDWTVGQERAAFCKRQLRKVVDRINQFGKQWSDGQHQGIIIPQEDWEEMQKEARECKKRKEEKTEKT